MSIDEIIRKTHVYTGLQASIALLIFSFSVIALPFESNKEPIISHYQFAGETSSGNIQLAKEIMKKVGLRLEPVPEWWMISEDKFGKLLIKIESPNAKREIRLNKTNGDIEITSWLTSFPQFINHMHKESIGRRRLTDNAWLWAWSLYIELSILALFALPITGLYIWVLGKSAKKYWANLSLVSSSLTMLILWNIIRY